jgi:hypothetical protein
MKGNVNHSNEGGDYTGIRTGPGRYDPAMVHASAQNHYPGVRISMRINSLRLIFLALITSATISAVVISLWMAWGAIP